MPGIFKKKKPSGICRILRLMSGRKDRHGLMSFAAGRKAAKASVRKPVKLTAAAAGLSKKDAKRAETAAKVMTKAEMGILKAGIGIGIAKAVHSDKAKQLLCGAVERFLQL